ncbi:SDR family NAD(P)-dependent oxidoreductase [Holzapfeliella sp. He02]|uniref:SDR family NAD(P)-dependent oxidoreductase n=1 Tax=Holzapfeliella saturejae TaxID=3082953 RepID=A0ABU8SIA4_9LACO
MISKKILITGATDGIGKVTAMTLAEKGHHIIVHGRSQAKAQKVVAEIKQQTGNQNIDYLLADLLSMTSIRAMADEFKKRYQSLDVLINNAGAVFDNDYRVSKDGIEVTLALNTIAPFLLTQLLLENLERSDDGRIINLTSNSHRASGHPDLTDLNFKKIPSSQRRYSLSKLFVIWNTRHLDKLLQECQIKTVAVNAAHPGAVATNFGQDSDKGFLNNLIYKVALRFMSSPEKGAATSVHLADSDRVRGISGKYWGNEKVQKPSDRYYSPENEQVVWDYCMKVCQPFLTNK